jgi:hypothetical protein
MRKPLVHFHVASTACTLDDCEVVGYHFHWRGDVRRSLTELSYAQQRSLERDIRYEQRGDA